MAISTIFNVAINSNWPPYLILLSPSITILIFNKVLELTFYSKYKSSLI